MASDLPSGAVDLLLIRLLPTVKRPPQAKAVRATLDRYLTPTLSEDGYAELVATARSRNLVEPKALRLTESGRAKAITLLGLPGPPVEATWKQIEGKLMPAAAGGSGGKAELAARLLTRQLKLPLSASATLPQVLVAIVSQKLGVPGETDLQRLFRRVLSAEAGSDRELGKKLLNDLLPRKILGLPNAKPETMRARLVRQWLGRDAQADEGANEIGLEQFAAAVREAAKKCPNGRFGPNKIFISHLWRFVSGERVLPQMELAEFKRRLLGANRARKLDLNRADMGHAMNADDVRESKITDGDSLFHFLVIS